MSKVNIFIDGKEFLADSEKTLLDNILESGKYIPHLCHNKELESYGGCGLCLVMVDGINKPLRACSTAVREGMSVTTSTPAIEKSRKATLSLIMSDHSGDCKAPCFMACPTHQDVQAYVGLIANGQVKEAVEVIKKDNPLPASIGRVCPHPCEEKCRRKHLEGAVSICALKRYAADSYIDYMPECGKRIGKRIAVIGAGPAGLSCAYFLNLKGYEVTVFEAQERAGGMLRYGIPAYRLPKDVLDKEIDAIVNAGVNIVYNKWLGKDFTVEALKSEYDAVFVGIGAWSAWNLGCKGDDAQNVMSGIDLLYRVANGERPDLGKNVCVVGGGNTAIDAVRTAVRLGAENVTLVYRRTEAEMPAEAEEIRDARVEGVNFHFLAAPVEVEVCDGRAVALKVQNMVLGEPDASGRRSPVPVEGSIDSIPCDTIISAIGQKVASSHIDMLELTRKQTISVDETSFMTSVEGVFAAGDVINKGADIAIRAIAGGKYAAIAIDSYLKGEAFKQHLPLYSVNDSFNPDVLQGTEQINRCEAEMLPAQERINNFNQVAHTLSHDVAKTEASRCLECGCSSVYTCELLPLARDYGALSSIYSGKKRSYPKDKSHPFIVRDNSKCILCGQCVRACKEISHTENLGLFGRGFATQPVTAFSLPLGESECVSCGACVISCPTGALSFKTPAVKNPPLPIEESDFVCSLCGRKCAFKKRTINGRTVAMLPEKLGNSCSLGMFQPVIRDNFNPDMSAGEKSLLLEHLYGSLEMYVGDAKPEELSFEDIINL